MQSSIAIEVPSVVFTVGALRKYMVVCQHITIRLFLETVYMIICYALFLSGHSTIVCTILRNL